MWKKVVLSLKKMTKIFIPNKATLTAEREKATYVVTMFKSLNRFMVILAYKIVHQLCCNSSVSSPDFNKSMHCLLIF
jgi:hypothetical protein